MAKNEKFEVDPVFRTVFNYADKTDTIRLEDWFGLLTFFSSVAEGSVMARPNVPI